MTQVINAHLRRHDTYRSWFRYQDDGSIVRLRKTAPDFDPTNRDRVYAYVRERQAAGEIATGLLYIEQGSGDMLQVEDVVQKPLVEIPFEDLCPGAAVLDDIMARYR